jgi:GNAT superfamily N-acetyltransferase
MHVLDNPVWHALTGPHATLAERVPLAARYPPEVSIFSALPDTPTNDAWDALRDLVGPGAGAFLARNGLEHPDDWIVQVDLPCRQMWLPDSVEISGDVTAAPEPIVHLGADDVTEMLELVRRTEPGPFAARTIELGAYLGIRHDGALIAMAGERLRPPGFTEISAVCTDPAYRGRGLASRLVRALITRIRARAETPCLHLTMKNEPARRVYAALGFETRCRPSVVGLQAPK